MHIKKTVSLLTVLLLLTALFPGAVAGETEETWAVYMYICGSDLESKHRAATDNILEIWNGAPLPENVSVIMEAGGTKVWNNSFLDPEHLEVCRFASKSSENSLYGLGMLPLAPMSRQETFEDFLQIAKDSFPADHTMLIVWDHGGGTLGGACKDENFPEEGTLSLREMQEACRNVFGYDPEDPPIDIIGFDCCLMSTIDVAEAFHGCAKYLLASEETIPSGGWDYNAITEAFAADPGISPEELGVTICDSYGKKYAFENAGATITLSMTDLSRVPALIDAYDQFGYILLGMMYEYPEVYKDLALITQAVDNYGGNSRAAGYTNLVDLYDFTTILDADDEFDQAVALRKAIDDCVVYNITGDNHGRSRGLSFFFPFTRDLDGLRKLDVQGAGNAIKCFYSVAAGKELSGESKAFMKGARLAGMPYNPDAVPNVPCFATVEPCSRELSRDEDGVYFWELSPEMYNAMLDATVELYTYDEDDFLIYLGKDNTVIPDDENCVVISSIDGKWPMIGGIPVFSCLDYDVGDYNIYSIPVYCENELFFLQRGYDFTTGEWQDLGARHSSETPNSRFFYFNEENTIAIVRNVWDDVTDKFRYMAGKRFPYSDDLFSYESLPDGEYFAMLVLEDSFRDTFISETFYFTIANGEVCYD